MGNNETKTASFTERLDFQKKVIDQRLGKLNLYKELITNKIYFKYKIKIYNKETFEVFSKILDNYNNIKLEICIPITYYKSKIINEHFSSYFQCVLYMENFDKSLKDVINIKNDAINLGKIEFSEGVY